MQPSAASYALVADLGTDTFRAGCAGDEAPRVVFPSLPGSPGEQLRSLLARAAGAAAGRSAGCSGRPVLLAEPNAQSRAQREALAEALFEQLELPAVALVKSSALSALAFGHTSAVVVDVGASLASVAPVQGCKVGAEHLRECPFAGRALDMAVLAALREQGVEVASSRAESPAVAASDAGGLWGREQLSALRVAQDLKETVCFCSHMPLAAAEPAAPFLHRLPDGQQVDVATFSRSVPEALLVGDGRGFPGVPSLLLDSLASLRGRAAAAGGGGREPSESVLLVGGSSLLVNFRDRLEAALAQGLPSDAAGGGGGPRVKASASRRHAAWLGGSVVASCGAMASIWSSRRDYEEHGAAILSMRCA